MNAERKALLELNVAVILLGFTAILGALIHLNALEIVWWRLLITCVSLALFIPVVQQVRKLNRRQIYVFGGIGCIVAVHWLTFYGSIKLANASTALVCFATTSFFTSMIEPLVMGQRFEAKQLFLGLLIIPAMILVTHALPTSYYWGMALGIFSAFLAALFASFNKKYVHDAPILLITFIELFAGFILLSIIIIAISCINMDLNLTRPSTRDFLYLLVLGLLCTTLAYVLALRALKFISAFGANLVINLEPVYGIALAFFILSDKKDMSPTFYFGAFCIIVIVLAYFLIVKPVSQS